MYSHFMVPVDGTLLSFSNVDSAVQLAARLQARITFFHASDDFASSGEGALLRTTSPHTFSDAALADTNALLAKARLVAQLAGVPCDTQYRVSERPADAIIKAALEAGCDLIVMASRGNYGITGWLHSSQMARILRNSPLPLLVTRVSASVPLSARERAIAIIQDEHRTIAIVVRALQDMALNAKAGNEVIDLQMVKAMLVYLEEFPLQLHHPKEEQYIHRILRARGADCADLLAELESQHLKEHVLVAGLLQCVNAAPLDDAKSAGELVALMIELAQAVWKHMRLEEAEILPLVKRHFRDDDWDEVVVAFEANNDPGFGDVPLSDFQHLFNRIANRLPKATR